MGPNSGHSDVLTLSPHSDISPPPTLLRELLNDDDVVSGSAATTPVAVPVSTSCEDIVTTVRTFLGHWGDDASNDAPANHVTLDLHSDMEESVEFYTADDGWERVDAQTDSDMWVVNGSLVEVSNEDAASRYTCKPGRFGKSVSPPYGKKGLRGWFQKRKEKKTRKKTRSAASSVRDQEEIEDQPTVSAIAVQSSLPSYPADDSDAKFAAIQLKIQLEDTARRIATLSGCTRTRFSSRDDYDISREQDKVQREEWTQTTNTFQEPKTSISETTHNESVQLFVLGSENSGKTSLLQRILYGDEFDLLPKPQDSSRLGVDIHEWSHPIDDKTTNDKIRFKCWDFAGQRTDMPGTHEMFMSSPDAVYLLSWDMGTHNPSTYFNSNTKVSLEKSVFESNQQENADKELEREFELNVQCWIDCIHRNIKKAHGGNRKAIVIPVLTFQDKLKPWDVIRRADLLKRRLQVFNDNDHTISILPETICSVSSVTCEGFENLKEKVVKVVTDGADQSLSVFGKIIPHHTLKIKQLVKELKSKRLDYIAQDEFSKLAQVSLGSQCVLDQEQMCEALNFLESIGDLICLPYSSEKHADIKEEKRELITPDQSHVSLPYEASDRNAMVILLNPKFIVNAISCVFDHGKLWQMDLRTSSHTSKKGCDHNINTNCPILCHSDIVKLWNSKPFMCEAVQKSRSKRSDTGDWNFDFLVDLMESVGLFVLMNNTVGNKLSVDDTTTLDKNLKEENKSMYFVPSLLTEIEEPLSYKTRESYNVILAQAYTTNTNSSCVGSTVARLSMKDVISQLLQDLSVPFPYITKSSTLKLTDSLFPCSDDSELPVSQSSLCQICVPSFPVPIQTAPDDELHVREILCWKSSMYVKFYHHLIDPDTQLPKVRIVKVFAHLEQPSSSSRRSWHSQQQRLIISARGPATELGSHIWKGGYDLIQDSIERCLRNKFGQSVKKESFCPICLSKEQLKDSSRWDYQYVADEIDKGVDRSITCHKNHRVDLGYLSKYGSNESVVIDIDDNAEERRKPIKKTEELYEGVVLVGLWDRKYQKMIRVGSGVLVDKKKGLIVTAAHIVLNMGEDDSCAYGSDYYNLADGDIVIGVVPKCPCKKRVSTKVLRSKCGRCKQGPSAASFRFFAEIVAKDISSDACVLKIKTGLERAVSGLDIDGERIGEQMETLLKNNKRAMKNERISELKLTTEFEYDECLRIIGYSQSGHGLWRPGQIVNRCPEVTRGHFCSHFVHDFPVDAKENNGLINCDNKEGMGEKKLLVSQFRPKNEIAVSCKTVGGQSGGPCVNQKGEVIGILCRAFGEKSYLVPSSLLVGLVEEARNSSANNSLTLR